MELISKEVKDFLGNSSMIRRMFEAGIELKKQYGADKVYDFSLGNPDLPPPAEVKTAMEEITAESGEKDLPRLNQRSFFKTAPAARSPLE